MSNTYAITVNQRDFRAHRDHYLAKYDILRLNVLNGDMDPATNQPYTPITQEEKQWRVTMLNFTNQITENTTASDYPPVPLRLQ